MKFILKFGVMLTIGFILLSFVSAVEPFGVENINVVNSTSSTPSDPSSIPAQAGNVTELNIFGYSVTQSWQGYFGNVSGVITLGNSAGDVMYNWSLADPEGEIYATRLNSVDWQNIGCFNWSESGSWLEDSFNISADDVDGVDETFNKYTHPLFYTSNVEISSNTCMSTNIYDSTGASNESNYHEVLLWDGNDVIFTSLLEEESVRGFDGKDHDFEMLVLEDGHNTDTEITPYYFYVELQ